MEIVVFGANGRTGNELTKRLAEKGHHVVAVARNISSLQFTEKNVMVVQAEATKLSDVERVLSAGPIDIVYSTIGAKGMFSRDLPLIQAMRNIVEASEKYDVKKVIHISFAGVRPDAKKLGFLYSFVIPTFMKNLVKDHREKDAILKNSKLNWILVQPPVLTSNEFTGKYVVEEHITTAKGRSLKCSRSNLAHYLSELAEQPDIQDKELFITE